jgi:hypothetical protein
MTGSDRLCLPAFLRFSGNSSTDLRCSIVALRNHALTVGTQLGSHEIGALLGSGMGEVYRAVVSHARLEAEAFLFIDSKK